MEKTGSHQHLPYPVVMFDGLCNLCNASVRFLLAYNRKKNLRFASLQSDFAKKFLSGFQRGAPPDALVFAEDGNVFTKSAAVFEISKHLVYPWRAVCHFKHIPRKFSDWAYGLIARNRYRWFGKKEKCMVPKPEWEHRFL